MGLVVSILLLYYVYAMSIKASYSCSLRSRSSMYTPVEAEDVLRLSSEFTAAQYLNRG